SWRSLVNGLCARSSDRMASEDVVEFHPHLKAFAAFRQVKANELPSPNVEAKADSAVSFKVAEVQLATPGKHFAAVGKQRHVDRVYHMPAILRVQRQAVVVVKAEGVESAKIFRAANGGLHVKRYGQAGV